jgi:ParB family transcriptional regulator, chromosome partitioning protein
MKKRVLGRGLSDLGLNELLSRMNPEISHPQPITEATVDGAALQNIPVGLIQPGKYQPRREMDANSLQELADSIGTQGIIQPIVVRSVATDRYEIIAGERRWRAAQLAGLTEIPAILREITDEAAIAMALIENIQRENLNAIEEATALHRLSHEFSLTHQEIAKMVGKSRTTISNLLRLLALNPDVKTLVEQGNLEMGHARALLTLEGGQQSQVAEHVVSKKLSVRETESYVRQLQDQLQAVVLKPEKAPEVSAMEKTLASKLGAKVAIKSKNGQRGKLIVYYRNQDHLQTILGLFNE